MFSNTFSTIKHFADNFASEQPKLNRISMAGNYQRDVTMLAAVRALLFNRLPEGEKFSLNISPINSAMFNGFKTKSATIKPEFLHNTFFIFFLDDVAINEADVTNVISKYPQYAVMQQHMDFLSSWLKCWIYRDTENNSAIAFISECNVRKMHMLFSMFPAYFQGIFDKQPLTESEKKDLCKSLTIRSSGKFEETLYQIAVESGLEQEQLAWLLRNYSKNNVKAVIDMAKEQKDDANERLNRNIEEYRVLYNAFKTASEKYEMLISKPIEEDTELVNYFKKHKNLKLYDIAGDALKFYVLTTLEWFDLNFYQRAASNNNAIYSMTGGNAFGDMNDRKLLMDAIFSDDPTFKIRICAMYSLSLTKDVGVQSHYDFPSYITKSYIPNPHLNYHSCLGDYREPIRKALRENNMIAAIEQCVASAQSVNIAERGATFDPFMRDVFGSADKILIDCDGKSYTPVEALKKLKEKV